MTNEGLQKEIEEMVATIAREYDPEQIILYGSTAQGKAHAGSDIDLLIIKDTAEKPLTRTRQVVDVLPHRVDVDIIVLTPAEMAARQREGHYLIKDILQHGKAVFQRRVHEID